MREQREPTFVDLRLWDQDALVLFDWLMSVDFDAIPITHPAQRQALTDLLGSIEHSLPPATAGEIEAAKTAVSHDMGW